jgi:hypothetical protein
LHCTTTSGAPPGRPLPAQDPGELDVDSRLLLGLTGGRSRQVLACLFE